jgi:hypothetical protein
MYIKTFVAALIFAVVTPVLSLAFSPALPFVTPSTTQAFLLEEVLVERPASGDMVIRMDLRLYVESDVTIEIRDALGKQFFTTQSVYPEGKQQIRVGVGGLPQGAYFVKVSTELESQSSMVLLEKP